MHDDYKVNKALLIACRNDVRSHHCLRGDVPKGRFAKMSHVLLCLEGVIREGEILRVCYSVNALMRKLEDCVD